jgi:hypothetical protein
MSKRPPPKRRGPTSTPQANTDQDDTRRDTAPGHLGGSFDHAGYDDQRWDGYFGFQPKPDWPVDKRRREARA